MDRMKHKVVIVTGGGSGIGQATALLLAKEGGRVVITDINQAAAQATADQIIAEGGDAIALSHDIACEQIWQQVIDKTLAVYNRLDVLVNNAGTGIESECKATTLDEWRFVMKVNLDGTFLGIRGALNAMARNPQGGSIINISSTYGLVGGGIASYSASKGGVTLLTKAVAAEVGTLKSNIRVNSVHPGAVDTPMSHSHEDETVNQQHIADYAKKIPMGRFAKASEIANGVLFLASDESSYMTGSELVIDGGYTSI